VCSLPLHGSWVPGHHGGSLTAGDLCA
jgi:hypothetical protein